MVQTWENGEKPNFMLKFVIQTHENDKKTHFRLDIDPLDLNSGRQIFFHETSS